MTSKAKTSLLVVLALTTLAGGILAWQQSRALAALRSTLTGVANDDRSALEKKLADAEHRAHDLANELAALKARPGGPEDAPPEDPQAGNEGDRRGRLRGPGGREAFLAMMNDPKAVQLMNSREKLMLDSRYASLFKSLMQGTNGTAAMTPEQLDAFKNLLVEKENTLRDVMMTARSQGVTDRSEINQLIKSAQTDLDTQLQSTLGTAAYEQYQQYEQTLPERNLVNQLTQSLSYTSAPLSDAQSQQLLQILADNSKKTTNGQLKSALGMGGGPGGGLGGVQITDAAITQAQSVLSETQVQALSTLQQQQKAQQTLMETMRANRQSSTSSTPPTAATTPSK